MPLIRDDEEERRTRIEHMLEQLQHRRDSVSDTELALRSVVSAREALRSATRMSKAARLERVAERGRTSQTFRTKKR